MLRRFCELRDASFADVENIDHYTCALAANIVSICNPDVFNVFHYLLLTFLVLLLAACDLEFPDPLERFWGWSIEFPAPNILILNTEYTQLGKLYFDLTTHLLRDAVPKSIQRSHENNNTNV